MFFLPLPGVVRAMMPAASASQTRNAGRSAFLPGRDDVRYDQDEVTLIATSRISRGSLTTVQPGVPWRTLKHSQAGSIPLVHMAEKQ